MQKTPTNVMQKSANAIVVLEAVFVTATVLLFSMPSILYQQQLRFTDYAEGTSSSSSSSSSCIDYNRTDNTISISCVHASFTDVANTVKDPAVLEKLRGDNGSEYLLKANLQVEDDATLSMGPPNDIIKWLKITGANGIIVNGKIEMDGVKI